MSKFGFMKQSFYIGMINCIIDWKFLIKFIIQYRQSDIMFWIWLTFNLCLLQKGFNWSSAIQYCLTLHTLVNSKWKLKSKCCWNTLVESNLLNQFPKRQKGIIDFSDRGDCRFKRLARKLFAINSKPILNSGTSKTKTIIIILLGDT